MKFDPEESYTLNEIGVQLKVQPGTVRTWIKSGKLKGYKLNLQWRVMGSELQRMVNKDREAS